MQDLLPKFLGLLLSSVLLSLPAPSASFLAQTLRASAPEMSYAGPGGNIGVITKTAPHDGFRGRNRPNETGHASMVQSPLPYRQEKTPLSLRPSAMRKSTV